MPEHRLIEEIVRSLKQAVKKQNGERLVQAQIKLSEVASVTPAVVEKFLRRHNEFGLDSAQLDIEIVPILGDCEKCEEPVEIDGRLCCTSCGSPCVTLGDYNTVVVSSCTVESRAG